MTSKMSESTRMQATKMNTPSKSAMCMGSGASMSVFAEVLRAAARRTDDSDDEL